MHEHIHVLDVVVAACDRLEQEDIFVADQLDRQSICVEERLATLLHPFGPLVVDSDQPGTAESHAGIGDGGLVVRESKSLVITKIFDFRTTPPAVWSCRPDCEPETLPLSTQNFKKLLRHLAYPEQHEAKWALQDPD